MILLDSTLSTPPPPPSRGPVISIQKDIIHRFKSLKRLHDMDEEARVELQSDAAAPHGDETRRQQMESDNVT